MTIVDGITIGALIAGPVIAVIITRFCDETREAKQRKWEIFRNLMRYRSDPLSEGFVSSLNLIEVEFHKNKSVLTAWKSMYDHFYEEEPVDNTLRRAFYDKQGKLRAKLLQEVAGSLGIKLNSLDIFQSGYYPKGWEWNETEQLLMRRLLAEVLEGKRTFPVHISNIPNNQEDANSDNL